MTNTIWDDRLEAHEAATEAAAWLRALQATETWEALPIEMRQTLCRAHGTLQAFTTAMVDVELV